MVKTNKKYIFITGGVTSSLGKGLASAAMACLLERRGISINLLKMDPYINVDPGTMSPTQHGEVFVTDDGAETDLDLGHYERFTQLTLSRKNNFTSGQVYLQVIENEREGKYLGKTVQVVPHITDEIKRRIHVAAEECDLLLAEIGGTVGDIESLPFLEAIRQFSHDVGPQNVLLVHLVLVPYLEAAGEQKTKPAQHSVKELRSIGLFPHLIICRSDREMAEDLFDKISLFCNVPKEQVFTCIDTDSIYKVPLNFFDQGLDEKVTELLGIWTGTPQIQDLKNVVYNIQHPERDVVIGVVGKYTELTESYKSLGEALFHGATSVRLRLKTEYIDSDLLEKGDEATWALLKKVHGILVPGGFGVRGTEGKIQAIKYARESKTPYFGICLGMQLAVIEYARHCAGIKDAVSEEFTATGSPVIHFLEGQDHNTRKGGSMRLGAYACHLQDDSLAAHLYNQSLISERHRHRLEVNNKYVDGLKEAGLIISGMNPDKNLVEVVELDDHPYFIAVQFHPEFKSRPFAPHPLFVGFVQASAQHGEKK
jgi:CTP synthase